ncbi:MAG: TIM barrel protein, partial [Gaiellaceae bacterium]
MIFGAHCSGGVKGALENAIEIGADAVQLFVQSPRMWRFPEHDPGIVTRFRERRAEAGIGTVLVHALYLCNLAAPDPAIYSKSVQTMRSTMEASCAISADGVVFHVGSHLGAGFDAGLARAVPALRQVLELCSDETWLLLENSAGAGGTSGRSLEELAVLVEELHRHPQPRVRLPTRPLFL